MLKPFFGAEDEEWVVAVGRFMLNMGAIEAATVQLVARIAGKIQSQSERQELKIRMGFLRGRFPRDDKERHKWAMNIFDVAMQLATFRDIIAHSPVKVEVGPDGSSRVAGILDVRRNELISLVEITGRIDESALAARGFLEMQTDFSRKG
jgi:hypothetical protein